MKQSKPGVVVKFNKRWFRSVGAGWLTGLALSLLLLLGSPAHADTPPRLPASVQVAANEATPDFPTKLVFKFKASETPGGPVFKSLDLAYKLEGDVATSVRSQNLAAGAPLQAEVTIDTRDDYVPPGTTFNFYWRLTDQAGQIYETEPRKFTYQDTRYPFRELKKSFLTVRWYEGSQVFGQQALDKAASTVDRLGQLYQAKPDHPINITIYPDSRTMFTALPPHTEEWVGGQAIPQLGTIVLAIAPNDTNEIGRSIPHEISHQVVYQATRNPYNTPPKWLDEGLAVNNQAQVDGFLTEAYERGRASHTLFALRVLNGAFPTDSQQSFEAYGQSVQVVRYIIKKYGEGAIEKMLGAFKEGRSYDEVVQVGVGLSVDELDREWKQSIGYPVPPLAEPTARPSPTTVLPATRVPDPTLPPVSATTAPVPPTKVIDTPDIAPDPTVTLAPTLSPVSPRAVSTPVAAASTPPPTANDNWPLAGAVGAVLLVVVGLAVLVRIGSIKRR